MAERAHSRSSRQRIAVIEDDSSIALMLRYNFEAAGYDVAIYCDGRDADAELRRDLPDLVILDWGLPGISGLEVLRRLRFRSRFDRHIPEIMLTGRNEHGERSQALDVGADIYVVKPFSLRDLMEKIDVLIARATIPPADLAEAAR